MELQIDAAKYWGKLFNPALSTQDLLHQQLVEELRAKESWRQDETEGLANIMAETNTTVPLPNNTNLLVILNRAGSLYDAYITLDARQEPDKRIEEPLNRRLNNSKGNCWQSFGGANGILYMDDEPIISARKNGGQVIYIHMGSNGTIQRPLEQESFTNDMQILSRFLTQYVDAVMEYKNGPGYKSPNIKIVI